MLTMSLVGESHAAKTWTLAMLLKMRLKMLSFIESQGTFCCPTRQRAKNGDHGANLELFTEVEDASDVALFIEGKTWRRC